MTDGTIVVIMGSEKDMDFTEPALDFIENFGVSYDVRVASAHKTPEKVMDILKKYEESKKIVYLTVAGRSNALSGFVDANTGFPVIACPPYSSKYGGADVFSSLRMPSGVSPMVVLDPKNAALACLKILSIGDPELRMKISDYKEGVREEIRKAEP
ncbi:MAG: AIR carboxylase family protein [Candidatus Hadarchaeia archaeon]